MVDEVDITPQFDDLGLSFFDADQLDNVAHGIANNKDGLEQWMYSVGESLGLNLPGTVEHYTDRANRRRAAHAETKAGQLPGAGAVELVGEILPWMALPAGAGSIARGATMGAMAGASIFNPDADASRLPSTLAGAGIGGLFGRLTKAKAVEDEIAKIESPGTSLVPYEDITGMSSPRMGKQIVPVTGNKPPVPVDGTYYRQGASTPLAPHGGALPAPAAARQAQLPPPPNRVTPSDVRRGELLDPLTLPSVQTKLGGKGVKQSDVIEGRFQNLDIVDVKLSQKADELSMATRSLEKATVAIKKVKDPAAKKLAENILKKERLDIAKEQYILNLINKRLNTARKALTNPTKPVQSAAPKKEVPAIINEGQVELRGSRLYLDGKPMSKYNALKAIDDGTPANQFVGKDPASYTSAQVRDFYNDTLGKKQAGEIDPRLLIAGGGAVAGGIVGGAASDGDPAGVVGGALAGLTGGALIGRASGRGASKFKAQVAEKKVDQFTKGADDVIESGSATKEQASEFLQKGKEVLDEYLGSIDTRIRNISADVANALQRTEFRTHSIAGDWMGKAEPLFQKINNVALSDKQMVRFKSILLTNRKSAATYLRGLGQKEAADAVDQLGTILTDVKDYMVQSGYNLKWKDGYFPRQVVDTKYFENIAPIKTHLEYLAKRKGVHLSKFEKEQEITKLFSGVISKGDSKSFGRAADSLKQRKWHLVSDERANAYADPMEGFNNYIEEVVRQAERQRFLKGQGVDKAIGASAENLDSAAKIMAKQYKQGALSIKEADEMAQLIAMRFGKGEQAPARWQQNFKNITYAGLLGNPIAAMTQIGDIALSAYRNGIANTAVGVVKSLGNMRRPMTNGLDKETLLGLRDAAQDFASNVKSRDVLNFALKYSGFRAMDRLGKNTFINAAMRKAKQTSKPDFISKNKQFFGNETEKLWNDIQNFEKITPENRESVGQYLWNQLEGVQPISLSDYPQRYLQHPDGRMFYMLQSFTLRLLNTMRNDIVQEIGKGQYKTAAKNFIKLGSLFTLMNGNVDMAKDVVVGRDMKEPAEYFTNAFMKMFGLSKFMVDTAGREGLGSAIGKTIMPPAAALDAIADPKKALNFMPPIGRLVSERI